MNPSHLAVSLLVLFIFLSSVQGFRLEKIFGPAGHRIRMQEGTGAGAIVVGDHVIPCRQGRRCSKGAVKKKISTVLKKIHHGHRLPSIHEDYYGPRKHRPRHH